MKVVSVSPDTGQQGVWMFPDDCFLLAGMPADGFPFLLY